MTCPAPETSFVTIPPQRSSAWTTARTVVVVPGTPQDLAAVILVLSATGWQTDAAVRLEGDLWRVELSAED